MGTESKFYKPNVAQEQETLSKAELIDKNKFSLKLRSDAVNAAKALNRELCGVDVLVDKNSGKHYILEVNKKTMLDEGSFVPEKMRAVSKFFEEL
jgi:D-alanine-D-alanine ligase-like ATP-grasp enzyme